MDSQTRALGDPSVPDDANELTPIPTGPDILDHLAADLDGSVVRPGDADWDEARVAWHLDVDQHPAFVVRPSSARDVVATVDAARRAGLRVAAQSTGHNAGPLGDLAGTVLIRMDRMRSVSIDASRRVAHVEAGALWQDVVPPAAAQGLAALAGSAPDVGVAGYLLGGGISWFARSHGLAANSVVGIEVVTADGRHLRVDEQHEPDLFWALRGGGGAFAVVTAIEFRLFAIRDVYAGVLFFPIERTAEVLHAWRAWVEDVPAAVTSVGRVLRFPPLPELPPELSGQSFVVIEAACQVEQAEADELLAPLRALGPSTDTFATTAVPDLATLHMDPAGPTPCRGDGALVTSLPPAAIDAAVQVVGPESHSKLLSFELRHAGGALAPGRSDGGAVSGLDAEFIMFAVCITPTPESIEAVENDIAQVHRALSPWTSGAYLNFAERTTDGSALFGVSHGRLRAVKHAYDPTDLVQSNHPV